MIFRILTLASALLLMAGCAANGGNEAATVAQADATAVSEAQAETQQAAEEDQLVCKTVVKTGTRLREKICAPKSAWDESAEYGRKATEQMQSKPIYKDGNSTGGGF